MSVAESFDRLLSEYYHAWFRHHPEAAVEAGVAGFEDRLTPFGDDDIRALTGLNEMLLAALDALDFAALDADRRIDFRLAYGAALLENHELRDSDWRFHDPTRYLPLGAIHQLFLRRVADPAAALAARLAAIPDHLRDARALLGQTPDLVPLPWLEAAVAEARAGAEWLRGLEGHPQLAAVRERHGLLTAAAHALQEYADFLDGPVRGEAAGQVACGERHFRRLLRYRHFLEVEPDRLRRLGEEMATQTRAALAETCRALHGHDDWRAALAELRQRHPPREELLARYRARMQAAHDFLRTHRLVTLPERTELRVTETPVWLRHQIPFAAYVDPAPNDPDQKGWYWVTPPADETALGEHHELAIDHTCVHEAWPGHHLQFVTANGRFVSRSLPRLLNASATLYEGWALYCEDLMQEQGFLADPGSRLVLLHDRLWRALRIVIDVDLHCGGDEGFEAGMRRLQEELGFAEPQARAELTWYSLSPTVPLGYATGWALIRALRADREREPDFDLRSFHDRLIGSGSMALSLAVQRGFGESAWQRALDSVFHEEERPS